MPRARLARIIGFEKDLAAAVERGYRRLLGAHRDLRQFRRVDQAHCGDAEIDDFDWAIGIVVSEARLVRRVEVLRQRWPLGRFGYRQGKLIALSGVACVDPRIDAAFVLRHAVGTQEFVAVLAQPCEDAAHCLRL